MQRARPRAEGSQLRPELEKSGASTASLPAWKKFFHGYASWSILLAALGSTVLLLYLQLPLNEARDGPAGLHFVWVSDCSTYQEWQSLALIWSILTQQGSATAITRLISGCSEEEKEARIEAHAKIFDSPFAASGLKLFFTEKYIYNQELNDTYPPYNRPHSLAEWAATLPVHLATRIVLLDPDMLMLRAMEVESQEVLYHGPGTVEQAKALAAEAQRYRYLATRWKAASLRLDEICEEGNAGCLSLTADDVENYLSAGPPWVVKFADLQRLLPNWQRYVPKIRKQYRQLIAEMYAYVLAAAGIGLRHALFDHYVVSYPNAPPGEQAWPWVEAQIAQPSGSCARGGCMQRRDLHLEGDHAQTGARECSAPGPTFLHYCEIYHFQDWYFQKRNVPAASLTSCEQPLLQEPPLAALEAQFRVLSEAADGDLSDWDRQGARQAWFLCILLSSLNQALVGVRSALCPEGFNSSKTARIPLPAGAFFDAIREFYKSSS